MLLRQLSALGALRELVGLDFVVHVHLSDRSYYNLGILQRLLVFAVHPDNNCVRLCLFNFCLNTLSIYFYK